MRPSKFEEIYDSPFAETADPENPRLHDRYGSFESPPPQPRLEMKMKSGTTWRRARRLQRPRMYPAQERLASLFIAGIYPGKTEASLRGTLLPLCSVQLSSRWLRKFIHMRTRRVFLGQSTCRLSKATILISDKLCFLSLRQIRMIHSTGPNISTHYMLIN
jgi:hypothetical protein